MRIPFVITQIKMYLIRDYSTILGFLFIGAYFWVRFLRSRLPREIPFMLNVCMLAVILFLCFLYVYQLFRLFKPRKSSWLLELFLPHIKKLAVAMIAFDSYVKNISYISKIYTNLIDFLVKRIPVSFKYWDKRLFYLDFFIKILLSLTFALDVLYFHKLFYFYKILFIAFPLLLPRYFIYCLRERKEKLIIFMEQEIRVFILEYRQGVLPPKEDYFHPEYVEDEDDDDLGPPINMALTPRKFIEYHCNDLFYEEKLKSEDYKMYIYDKCLDKGSTFEEKSIIYDETKKKTRKNVMVIYELFSVLEIYNVILIDSDFKVYYKIVSIITLSIYLTCWVYILIVSLKTLSINDLNHFYDSFSAKIEEPFSGQNESTINNK